MSHRQSRKRSRSRSGGDDRSTKRARVDRSSSYHQRQESQYGQDRGRSRRDYRKTSDRERADRAYRERERERNYERRRSRSREKVKYSKTELDESPPPQRRSNGNSSSSSSNTPRNSRSGLESIFSKMEGADLNEFRAKTAAATKKTSTPLKPIFMSKKQREQAALSKLKEKSLAKRKEQEDKRRQRERSLYETHSHDSRMDGRRMDIPSQAERLAAREQRARQRNERKKEAQKSKELQLIKEQYLGVKKSKKTVVPPSQKFKFNFDWEPRDDTSVEVNSIYMDRPTISLRYGRGFVGGIDREQQEKQNKTLWEKILGDKLDGNGRRRIQENIVVAENDNLSSILESRRRKRQEKQAAASRAKELEMRNWREKTMQEMSERDWRILKEEFRIATKFGGRLPPPIRFWKESGLPKVLLRAVKEIARYEEPTPIQRQAIPVGLQNRDCVGIAETGSGKTAAFVLPMLAYLLEQPKLDHNTAEDGPYSLVLAPTRELAQQIADETEKFSYFIRDHVRVKTIVGGLSINEQAVFLQNGVECIIATPGRLEDCITSRYLVLNQCHYLVLDEADRMIDEGFTPQVEAILDHMPATNLRPVDEKGLDKEEDETKAEVDEDGDVRMDAEEETEQKTNNAAPKKYRYRQTFMFSATMSPEVERLTKTYLRNPVYITIGDPNQTAAERVEQRVYWMQEPQKRKTLMDMLSEMEPPIMIFCNMKKIADTLSKYLRQQGYNAGALHGGKNQQIRQDALDQFKQGHFDVLVCTNVAGRGIDVTGVQHVINYDMPKNIQDYCHRIGRTGRAGMEGCATSFLTPEDVEIMYDLKRMLQKTDNHVPPELMSSEHAQINPRLRDKHQQGGITATSSKSGKMGPAFSLRSGTIYVQ